MNINLKKYLFYGSKEDLDLFFAKAQEKGILEFIGIGKKRPITNDDFKKFLSAIKILKRMEVVGISQSEKAPIAIDAIADNVIHLNDTLKRLEEEERIITAEISRIAPFGDFAIEDINYISKEGKRIIQFYSINSSKVQSIKIPHELIFITTEFDLNYYISFNKEKKSFQKFNEIEIDKSYSFLIEKKRIINAQKQKIQKDIKELSCYLKLLKKHLVFSLNEHNLKLAKETIKTKLEGALFTISSWIPENKIEKANELIASMNVCYEEIAIEKNEKVPTYLENKNTAKVGEDIVEIYDIPSTTDKDPSRWVLWAFTLFFAIIISDAGYGLIYLLIWLLLKYKFKNSLKPKVNRFVKLVKYLSISCVIWGCISGSFFGIGITPKSFLNRVTPMNFIAEQKAKYHIYKKDDVYSYWVKKYPKLKNVKSEKDFLLNAYDIKNNKPVFTAADTFKNNILMEISLFIGAFHLCISFIRNLYRNFAGVGWIIFIIGGYLYFPFFVEATTFVNYIFYVNKSLCYLIGPYLVFSGIGIAVFFAIIKDGLLGIKEVTNVLSVFADILSYLRLYALALAGMIMANTFNGMGSAMPLFFGIFVIIIGHLVNIILGIMGGVIHGLRLNFLEWYNHCFEGDGKIFNPLKLFKP
jgi:V/A-type H+/Na+-transporting ATPase subunit I